MFVNEELNDHLESSFSVSSRTAVVAEWNMNIPGNIARLGNYRYRKDNAVYKFLPSVYDSLDSGYHYTNATNSDITIETGLETDLLTPLLFTQNKDKEKLYYSLEDCLKPFRPRSGINKASYFSSKYLADVNKNMYLRPRYYMPHRDDSFKYWRSYRTESIASCVLDPRYVVISGTAISPRPGEATVANSNIEYGISKNSTTGVYFIDDAVPFVVYDEVVPANRIVLKTQTHVGSIDLGPFKSTSTGLEFEDPFYGEINKVVPKTFSVQYLDENSQWVDAYSFNEESLRDDGSPIFGVDGYLNLQYGLKVPAKYKNNFNYIGVIVTENSATLPFTLFSLTNFIGNAYLIVTGPTDRGTLFIFNGTTFDAVVPEYGWSIGQDEVYENTNFVTSLNNPPYYDTTTATSNRVYREFVNIKGLRIVVKTMSLPDVPFELIEMSPRLLVDISDKVVQFQLQKILSNLATSALPVGDVLASAGSLTLFDTDSSFNINNVNSIVSDHLQKNIKFLFYEVVQNVNDANYYIPLKTLYSQTFPQVDENDGNVTFELRDFYFYFESTKAPQILLTEVSLSQAVAILLDSIGFSNYVFKRLGNTNDPIIPFFFIPPDTNVAEILVQLAVSTQSAMFFDEYNNFVVMTKEYLLDSTGERTTDLVLVGSNNVTEDGVVKNSMTGNPANILNISSSNRIVYNNGNINYTTRYLQRTYGSIKQATLVGPDKVWIYKPVLLWEISGNEQTKSENAKPGTGYTLGAYPLNSDVTDQVPVIENGLVVNDSIDLGDSVYFLTRFSGYLYSAGEIIRYQSQEFTISGIGDVQIASNLEYQKYFSELPFGGKIYPTGVVNIYVEPYYETVDGVTRLKNGPVVAHGRGQFGTPIVKHSAGLDPYWTGNEYIQGCLMDSKYLFTTEIEPTIPSNTSGATGLSKSTAEKSTRTGIIKNFFSASYGGETTIPGTKRKSAEAGSLQSSALVFTGPVFQENQKPRDFVSYVWKSLSGTYKHFGTRVRIVGRVEGSQDASQTPYGSMPYFTINNTDPSQSVTIGGGSAGISLVDPATNNGYFFEIAAVTNADLNSLLTKDQNGNSTIALNNVMFYKVRKPSSGSGTTAIPVPLWGGIGNILVDDGNFTGQYRFANEENPTVYDLAIEYQDVGAVRNFYLYINQRLVKIVTDTSPIPIVNNTFGLFVRGTTKAMFENAYALGKNYAENSVFDTGVPLASVFGSTSNTVNAIDAMNKYALSGVIQKTYLSNISPTGYPAYNLYFEEFGSIMRECAYFNIKYDKAYPALSASIAPTFNRIRSYIVSGFTASSYGAEFLIFNATDTLLNLDETTGNYLRILGNTFTQDTTRTLTVDDYYKKRGNLSNPELKVDGTIENPSKVIEEYEKVRVSRLVYGNNDFSLQSNYIQDQDSAENIIGWLIEKSIKPRRNIGVSIFPNPTIQLGDLITFDYKNNDDIDVIAPADVNFIVYNIEYSKSVNGPEMTLYLSEV